MKTRTIHFKHLDRDDKSKWVEEDFIVPEDMVFSNHSGVHWTFLYPYSPGVEEVFRCAPDIVRTWTLNDQYIIGTIDTNNRLQTDDEMTFIDQFTTLDNSDLCVRENRLLYGHEVTQNNELHEILSNDDMSYEERLNAICGLDLAEIPISIDFRDMRIIGFRYDFFYVVINKYDTWYPGELKGSVMVVKERYSIDQFFASLNKLSPKTSYQWISRQDYDQRLLKTIKSFSDEFSE